VQKEAIVNRFLTGMPSRFEAATGNVRLCAVQIDCDPETGRATAIERIMLHENA
jgi:calcineurin-like phosphoesterase